MSKFSKQIGHRPALACAGLYVADDGPRTVELRQAGRGRSKLVVGYQPYYTESWSGVVINGKQLWKKYLPPGSTVEFQIGLQGAIIVNAHDAAKSSTSATSATCRPSYRPSAICRMRGWHGYPHRGDARHIEAAVQHLPRPQRRTPVQGAARRRSSGWTAKDHGLAAWLVHGSLRAARVQAGGHHAEDLPRTRTSR